MTWNGSTEEGTGLLSQENKKETYAQKTSFIHDLGTNKKLYTCKLGTIIQF